MYIYRIEDEKHFGPYRDSMICFDNWKTRNHCNINRHPNPDEDNIEFTINDLCGFKSLKQLYKWFTKKELNNLYKLNSKIVRIKINKKYVKFGKLQIMFDKNYQKEHYVLYKLEHKKFMKGDKFYDKQD